MRARPEIEHLVGHHVFLELKVKVKPKWRRDEGLLERLGIVDGDRARLRDAFDDDRQRDGHRHGLARGHVVGRGAAMQAAELGERRRDDGLAAVFTSDLGRAIETAEIAFAESELPVHHDWRLRECNYGELNGAPVAEIDEAGACAANRRALRGRRELSAGRRAHAEVLDDLSRPSWTARAGPARSRHVGATRWALQHLLGAPLEEVVGAPFDWQEGWEYARSRGELRCRARLLVWRKAPVLATRLRASARAAAAADRIRRRSCARGAGRDAREAVDQARGEAVRARPGGPDDGPDDARGRGHARQGRGDHVEGHPARSVRPRSRRSRRSASIRTSCRPRSSGLAGRASRSRRSRPRSRRVRRRRT